MVRIKLCPKISNLSCCSFSPDKNLLGCASINGQLLLINTRCLTKLHTIFKIHRSVINHFFFDNDKFLTASSDGICAIWNLKTLESVRNFRLMSDKGEDIDCINNNILTTSAKGFVTLWDQRILHSVSSINHGIPLKNGKFFRNEQKIISCGNSSEIFSWDLRNSRIPYSFFSLKNTSTNISSICFSKNFSFLFCLNDQNEVFRWSVNSRISTFQYQDCVTFPSIVDSASFTSLKISCDFLGDFVGHGNKSGQIFIKSQKKGNLIIKLHPHVGNVNQVSFHRTGRIIASCGDDECLVIHDLSKMHRMF